MSVGHLDIWISDVGTPCGVGNAVTPLTIVDCNGIFDWTGGRYRGDDGVWHPVAAGGKYLNLPVANGHIEVELPPGCYGVIAAWVTPWANQTQNFVHFNYATHMGLVTVCCGESSCVKLFVPTIRYCFDEFFHALNVLAGQGKVKAARVKELQGAIGDLIKDAPRLPVEDAIIEAHAALRRGKE